MATTQQTHHDQSARVRLESGSTAAWEAVRAVMGDVVPVIRGKLTAGGAASDVEDVAQETLMSAVRSVSKWDPARGTLTGWVTTIGKRRAVDHLRSRHHQATAVGISPVGGATSEDVWEVDVAQEGHEDAVVDRLALAAQIHEVLAEVRAVLRCDRTVHRALTLLIDCEGDTELAAKRLGTTTAVVREARRETVRAACVVQRAQGLHRSAQRVTAGALLDCLPAEIGAWTRTITVEAVRAGGFERVRVEAVAAATGWSISTARQRLGDTKWLLSIARTIAETGTIQAAA
ncbi:RNA polymerase sigma factor [Kocuria sp. ZOR0020]|uniref:RNA polymerase sigma factor n=1 Tax=Kocuria sp. ZOR0020 TaxID=1339234 RepID=UPI00068EA860|nr:sigma factor [Kocuria sp. ZOR0020]